MVIDAASIIGELYVKLYLAEAQIEELKAELAALKEASDDAPPE